MDNIVEKNFIEIAKIVSNDDKAVMDEVKECVSDVEAYFKNNIAQYEERSIYEDGLEDIIENPDDLSELAWIGIVDILEKNGYVCERDWQDELEDFIYFISATKGIKENNLVVEESWFDEDSDISEWCEVLDEKWQEQGYCVASFDINSDSYVLFSCNIKDFELLVKYADEVDYRIDLGKNL